MTEHESNLGKQIELNFSTFEKSILNLLQRNKLSKKTQQIVHALTCEMRIMISWHCVRANRNIPWAKRLLKDAFTANSFSCIKNKYFSLSLVMLHLPEKIQSWINNILPKVEV
jgi:hypothetical protein